MLEEYPEANLKWCQSQDIQFMASLPSPADVLTAERGAIAIRYTWEQGEP